MNKKATLTISLIGIFFVCVTLVLVSFGYAYINVEGNLDDETVTIKTDESEITFVEINNVANMTKMQVGYTDITVFTTQNTGVESATYSIYLTEVINDFVRTEDIKYTLYRNEGNNTIDIDTLDEYEVVVPTTEFPKNSTLILGNEVIETPNDYYTYVLKVEYIDQGELINQNIDQGKTLQYKIQIYDKDDIEVNENLLYYHIIENAKNSSQFGTQSEGFAVFTEETIDFSQSVGTNEALLATAEDDDGISYYFRGNVKNNYVNFANKCWRIVRIEGDKSIRLILEDNNTVCNDSKTNDINDDGEYYTGNWMIGEEVYYTNDLYYNQYENNDSYLKFQLLNWYNENLVNYQDDYLKFASQCLNDVPYDKDGNKITTTADYSTFYYDSYTRLMDVSKYNPTFKCTTKSDGTISTIEQSYVYPISADEVFFAGGKDNSEHYLYNGMISNDWWTISLSFFSSGDETVFILWDGKLYDEYYVYGSDRELAFARPLITLNKKNIWSKGIGTIDEPYEIVELVEE